MGRSATFLLLALAAVAPGVAAQASPDQVLARIGGEELITVADLEAEMARRAGGRGGQFATVDERAALLDEMVGFRAQVAAARAHGLDRDPEVVAVMERMMVSRLQRERLDPALESLSVSDAEVEAYYRDHAADYARPARSRIAIVFIEVPAKASEETVAAAEARAAQALAEARRLEPGVRHFGEVARRYSDDRSSRYQGGVIGWLVQHPDRRYRWPAEVVDAALALAEPGAFGPIIRTDEGLYLVRLVDREGSEIRPLETLADGIRHMLLTKRRDELRRQLLQQLVATVPVEIDRTPLAAIPPPEGAAPTETEKAPPRLPVR